MQQRRRVKNAEVVEISKRREKERKFTARDARGGDNHGKNPFPPLEIDQLPLGQLFRFYSFISTNPPDQPPP